MNYASKEDLEERFGVEAVLMASDREGTGEADVSVIERALADASAEIDVYIGSRYTVPLPKVPTILRALCSDVAMWKLALDTTATEQQKQRYDQAIKTLTLIAAGKVSLGITEREAGGSSSSGGASFMPGRASRFNGNGFFH